MPTAALLCFALLAPAPQNADTWQYHRLGKSGLQLFLPKAPTANPEQNIFTLEHEGLKVEIKIEPADPDRPLPKTERYLSVIGKYREEYKNRVASIYNEAEVLAALRFGATSSIGFTLEANGGAGASVGWHLVRIDGYDYEMLVTGDKRHFPWVLTVLDSQQYIDAETGKFKTAPIGGLGVQSLLGTAFLSLSGVEPERASSLVLQGDNLPVVGVAQRWSPGVVDYSTPRAVTEAFVRQLTATNIAQNPLIEVNEVQKDGQKTYVMKGEVFLETKKIQCEGLAYVFDEEAVSVVLLYDPDDKSAVSLAREILDSLKPVPK